MQFPPALKLLATRIPVSIDLVSNFRLSQHSHRCHPRTSWRAASSDSGSAPEVAISDVGRNEPVPPFFDLWAPGWVPGLAERKGFPAALTCFQVAHHALSPLL
jgi:hypothetical protein